MYILVQWKFYIVGSCVDNTDNADVNYNGCDWYKEEDNAFQCGDHDGTFFRGEYYFEAHEECCVCKFPSGIKKK